MKIRSFISFCLVICFWVSGAPAQFLNWNYVNILDNARESGENPDFAIDVNGGLHISAWVPEVDKLVYLYRAPGASVWSKEYVNPNTVNGYKSAIFLKDGLTPHLAYLENVNGIAQVRYAYRTGPNAWSYESIPGDPLRGWGQYGPTSPMVSSEKINHSLDLHVDAAGNPNIVFFDGYWETALSPPNCNPNGYYGLKMMQAVKFGNTWFVKPTGYIPDDYTSCSLDTLPRGDRFGEYCTLFKRPDGKFSALTTTRFNSDILHFRTTTDDTTWTWDILQRGDSVIGFPVMVDPVGGWATIYFTMEGLSATAVEDGSMFSVYTSSFLYGENFCCVPFYCGMSFAKIDTAGNYSHFNFGTSTYRNHTAIAAKNSDSIYFIYTNFDDFNGNQVLMKESGDGGLSWTSDTLVNWAATSRMKLEVFGDSLYAVIYNPANEKLLLATRHLNPADAWHFYEITKSENHGQYLDAFIEESAGDTTAHLAYNDNYNNKLYYNSGSASGGWNFIEEQIDSSGSSFVATSIARGPSDEPMILYGEGAEGHLKIAIRNGAVWEYEIIDSAVQTGFTQLAFGNNDSLYAVYYAADSQALKYARRSFSSGPWVVEYIDSTNTTGHYPSLAMDASGNLHIAYYNQGQQQLQYASRPASGGSWTIDSLYRNLPSAAGKYASLEIGSTGLPKVAFLDEMYSTVKLLEKNSGGTWDLTTIDSTSVPSNGKPIDLEIDNFGNPWVAWNHFANYDLVSLVHRDTSWHPVSINSTGRIANEFAFIINGNDLYIIGKKTEPGNTGIAMIYGPNGIFISNEDAEPEATAEVTAFPNPSSGKMEFSISLPQASSASLTLFDLRGVWVASPLKDENLIKGTTRVEFDGSALPSGVYFYRLDWDGFSGEGKVVILH